MSFEREIYLFKGIELWSSPSVFDFKSHMYYKYCCLVTQLCTNLWNPMDYSPPGSSVHGISQEPTGVHCHFLLQRIFLTQGSRLPLLFGRWRFLCIERDWLQGIGSCNCGGWQDPRFTGWVSKLETQENQWRGSNLSLKAEEPEDRIVYTFNPKTGSLQMYDVSVRV